ncbi:MAG: YihY family inner membrane protein [Burkholderiales bacterium]|nr:YihY family inner membrane protein [Burkholderiales bacterium]
MLRQSSKPAVDRGRGALTFIRLVFTRFIEERCPQIAGSLTFTALLALVPLITIALTVIAAFPVFNELSVQIKIFILSNLVPDSAGRVITVYMQQFADNAAKLTAVGIVFLAVTSIMLMMTIDRALNTIWRVKRPRSVLSSVLIYWMVLTIGPVLIGASLSLTSWILSISMGVVGEVPGANVALLKLVPIALTSLAFALIFLAIPNRRVRLLDALIGGVVAGLAFEAMKRGFAFYITQVPTYTLVYGTFASFPIFLVWIYLSWLVVLFGAVISAVLPYWRVGAWRVKPVPGSRFFEALEILKILWTEQQSGKVVTLKRLHARMHLGLENLEELLGLLTDVGWVREAVGNGWVMVKDASEIKVADVYRLLVFRADSAAVLAGSTSADFDELAETVSTRVSHDMQMTLKELFITPTRAPGPELLPA